MRRIGWLGVLLLLAACGGGRSEQERQVDASVFLQTAPGATGTPAQVAVDPDLPEYQPKPGVAGRLSSIGSDTMNNLMALWAEEFKKYYPNVKIEVEGKGSSTAPPALIQGTAQLGPMSRPMKASERDAFEKAFGYSPTEISVALDGLALFVHKDNPIDCLTLPQVDAIFSKTRLLGHPQDIRTWGDLGLRDPWANRPISLYGRNSASGTYGFFKDHALGGGDFKANVKEQPGSASVVQGVSVDPNGIGYSGIGFVTSSVKALSIAARPGEPCYAPTPENIYKGRYPLWRPLYIYVNRKPNGELDPLVREFLNFVLSKQGQEVVIRDGYLPLHTDMLKAERRKLGLNPDAT
ncbi:MAG: phosphate ABC transporter substrate-binding protein PstS family protein [Bacteroidetes bacterium]|nr:phosphate ABC transporter substrate-binding protein PstS family protein [Rhodothermia bacterium]MCS7155630.1 phosphate ABC transporter substrate-binding protein PstS family protein [Bacteroidota bacterium]MCX7906489.1 phosphate ABC transporter substrate-binding protein PstS family protein [Bacteroidota bacterium]MDW8137230.1 phosphate ABC transporter substrate-binding protein PstS family protein [Bacteroidota bacterium]MDW8284900.1 phosphate ABC transporter substrate-binding protein PstS fam